MVAFLRFFSIWALCLVPAPALSHDIPNDARVQAFVKPAGDRLQLLVRVPMAAVTEVDYPEREGGFIDLARVEPALRGAAALWLGDNIRLYEGEERLVNPRVVEARISLPSERSFATYDTALAKVQGPRLPVTMNLIWNQQLLDVLIEYPIHSERSRFSIDPHLERLALKVAITLQFMPPGSPARAFELHGNAGLVHLDPRWHQAALRFVQDGFLHILDGTDHLLFILCLVIPFRNLRALVWIVTAFTVAHSITLIGSALGWGPGGLWFAPLVETLVAVSILYMALENIVAVNLGRRWMLAFAFGLVHGFGFSFALRESLQFAGSHLITSLLAFNVGVELGQLAVLVVLVPALQLLFRRVLAERLGTIILSALVAHTAWHWMLERGERLRQFPWPTLDAAAGASLMRWAMAILVIAAIAWLARGAFLRAYRRGMSPRNR